MQGIDQGIVLAFQNIRCDLLTNIFVVFIPLEFWSAAFFVFVLLCFFRTRMLRVPLISFILADVMSNFCYQVIKHLVNRPRPFLTVKGLTSLIIVHGFSFPSFHATLSMAMAVVLSHHFPKSRSLVFTLAVLFGISRLYFGVHYLTDVLAGFILGAALGYLAIFLERTIIDLAKGIDFHGRTN